MIARLGERVRDPQHLATPEAVKQTILSEAQRVVAVATKALITPSTRTYTPTLLPVVDYTTFEIASVVSILVFDRELPRVPWRTLAQHDPYWITRAAPAPTCWDMIGRRHFLLWPRPIGGSIAYKLRGVAIPPDLGSAGLNMAIDDQHMPGILTLAEQLLLLRQRLLVSLVPAAERQKADVTVGRAT